VVHVRVDGWRWGGGGVVVGVLRVGFVVTARDELEADLRANPPYHCVDCLVDPVEGDQVNVDDLLAAGWRKMPSKDALTGFMRRVSPIAHEPLATTVAEEWADAVLALMDGDNE